MRLRLRFVAVAAVMLAALAGCGSDNKVGDERLLDFEEQVGERLGETTTTTAPPVTTTTAGATQATKPGGSPAATVTTATTRPTAATQPTATTATTAPPQAIPALEIFIYDDNAPAPIEPQYARQFVGSVVRWVNKDTVVRGVKATTTRFPCESIPPGGSCDFKPTAAGLFDYGDSTRPYVNATLEVLPKE
ncbi:MAG: hypothetical protein M3357_16275 [Actinomycetota bacterium]|nr:hypothetical protein [Actinomycetota bacterium]